MSNSSPCLGTCPGLDLAFFQAHQNFPPGGTILEFGVAGGYSYSWMAWWIANRCPVDILIGFDSWQGLPKETEGVWYPECHREGNYKYEPFWVGKKCLEAGVKIEGDPRFQFVNGFFKDTLTAEFRDTVKNVILINMDVDLHSSATEVLNWIVPLLRPGVMIYSDDWLFPMFAGSPDRCGVSLAFEQWQARNPSIILETVRIFPNSQRYFQVKAV